VIHQLFHREKYVLPTLPKNIALATLAAVLSTQAEAQWAKVPLLYPQVCEKNDVLLMAKTSKVWCYKIFTNLENGGNVTTPLKPSDYLHSQLGTIFSVGTSGFRF